MKKNKEAAETKRDVLNWRESNYAFTQNLKCEWFPCHRGIEDKDFNCLFCFCPLYALGRECGGNFSYKNKQGIKDCSGCIAPHRRDSYGDIVDKTKILVERIREK